MSDIIIERLSKPLWTPYEVGTNNRELKTLNSSSHSEVIRPLISSRCRLTLFNLSIEIDKTFRDIHFQGVFVYRERNTYVIFSESKHRKLFIFFFLKNTHRTINLFSP